MTTKSKAPLKARQPKPWSMKKLHCHAVLWLRYGYSPDALRLLAEEASRMPQPAAQWLSSCFETAAFAAQRAKLDPAVAQSPGGYIENPRWLPDPDESLLDRARAALEKFATVPGFCPEVVPLAECPRRDRPALPIRFGSTVIAFRPSEAA